MKKNILTLAVPLSLLALLTGCGSTPADPYDAAFTACVELYEEISPDGITHAETGEHYDSTRSCDSAAAAQGREHFTELFLDAQWRETYREAMTQTEKIP
ncbi:hypothetical protein [Microbacterium invictum]|uniref:Lipoprotein n=1 Tax=Microbacterium invictum TaxID=515415 RepID=A0ABZ0VH67_9MICO|nr:hypothetical protein [Microbacterium invictum]WQB71971.1 hypothetical protein T9R20_08510 [Microbacterium invictum]